MTHREKILREVDIGAIATDENGIFLNHRYSDIFPLMEDKDLAELAKDLMEHGLKESIKVFEGKILDGRNRIKVCLAAGITPVFEEYIGTDPIGYSVSLNMHRRHLTPAQKARAAARVLEIFEDEAKEAQREAGKKTHGHRYKTDEDLQLTANLRQAVDEQEEQKTRSPTSTNKAAQITGASPRQVEHAKRVYEHGIPDLQQAIDKDEIPLYEGSAIAGLPEEDQKRIIELPKPERKAALQEIKTERKAEKVKVETGISKEYTSKYNKLFFALKDISETFLDDKTSEEAAREALEAFPFHVDTFVEQFIGHLPKVAVFIRLIAIHAEQYHERRKTEAA